jgi:hypothetical protein
MTTQAQQIAQLQTQVAQLTKGMRQILEARLTGADGAAGTVVALEGGQSTIEVHPFDSCP